MTQSTNGQAAFHLSMDHKLVNSAHCHDVTQQPPSLMLCRNFGLNLNPILVVTLGNSPIDGSPAAAGMHVQLPSSSRGFPSVIHLIAR